MNEIIETIWGLLYFAVLIGLCYLFSFINDVRRENKELKRLIHDLKVNVKGVYEYMREQDKKEWDELMKGMRGEAEHQRIREKPEGREGRKE